MSKKSLIHKMQIVEKDDMAYAVVYPCVVVWRISQLIQSVFTSQRMKQRELRKLIIMLKSTIQFI